MAPQTRARGATPVAAPSTERVYRSSRPPQQAHFPARNKIVRTYGRRPARLSPSQKTLTQIDYLVPADNRPDDDEDKDGEEDDEERRRRKRRKTMGDTPVPSFQTQTLTQFLSGKAGDSGDETASVPDSEGDDEIFVPQTPAHKKIKAEIPSSQPSPFTPMLSRYSVEPHRSPLKEKSTNVDAPSPTVTEVTKIPTRRVIPDSHGTAVTSSLGSVAATRTPLKSLHLSHQNDKPGTALQPLTEIPDSDDELGSLGPTPSKDRVGLEEEESPEPGTPTPLPRAVGTPRPEPESPTPQVSVIENTPTRGTPGHHLATSATSSAPSSSARRHSAALPRAVLTSSAEVEKETPFSSSLPRSPLPQPSTPSRGRGHGTTTTPAKSQFPTQALESQRVPLEILRDMAPTTDRSDIIITLTPDTVDLIAAGAKTHEFRDYAIPPTVVRFWVYVSHPACELRYMAVVSGAKRPGDIDPADAGAGNADFNAGRGTRFAYELLDAYILNNPVSLAVMRRNGWVDGGPPERYSYVPPAVVGELLGNLRCGLFEDGEGIEESQLPSGGGGGGELSISQEVEEQLRSDVEHTTQGELRLMGEEEEEVVPSSQGLPVSTSRDGAFVLPPVPSRPTRQPAPPTSRVAAGAVRPSQATTTASQVSTQVLSPEKAVARPHMPSSIPSFPEYVGDSPIGLHGAAAFDVASSQVFLPDSLTEGVRQAPPVVRDSEDEDSDGLGEL